MDDDASITNASMQDAAMEDAPPEDVTMEDAPAEDPRTEDALTKVASIKDNSKEDDPMEEDAEEDALMETTPTKSMPMTPLRCKARNSKGARCSNKALVVKDSLEAQNFLCYVHASLDKDPSDCSESSLLHNCDGFKADGSECRRYVGEKPIGKATFCSRHADQQGFARMLQCYGSNENGERCTTNIRWTTPFFQYCNAHSWQADQAGCPILRLPELPFFKVLDFLSPENRVAFALASRDCRDSVIRWSGTRPAPDHTTAAMLGFCAGPNARIYPEGLWPSNLEAVYERRFPVLQILLRQDRTSHRCSTLGFAHRVNCWGKYASILPLFRVMYEYPYLFPSPQAQTRCVICKRPVNPKEAALGSSAPGLIPQSALELDLPEKRYSPWRDQKEREYEAEATSRERRLVCSRACAQRHAHRLNDWFQLPAENGYGWCGEMMLRWCTSCYGPPGPLAYARAYWLTQRKPRNNQTSAQNQ